jgi:hypothetical protein
MRSVLPSVGAVIAVAALLAWLVLNTANGSDEASGPAPERVGLPSSEGEVPSQDGDLPQSPDGPAQADPSEEGDRIPCREPLKWHVAAVDPRFGMGMDEVERVASRAAALWNGVLARPVLVAEDGLGVAIRLLFDDRQERTLARLEMEAEFQVMDRELEELASELEAARTDWKEARSVYYAQKDAYNARLGNHNREVRRWSQAGGVAGEEIERLQRGEDELARKDEALKAEALRLESWDRQLREQAAFLARRVEDRNDRAAVVEEAFPPIPVESGSYRKTLVEDPDGATRVVREMRVYRFDDQGDLARVLTHEFGHALGLTHAASPDAVMSPEYGASALTGEEPSIHSEDRSLLGERCAESL